MYTLFLIIHIITCTLLIAVILVQRGRGGGLVESFSGVESMFGPNTNVFLVRVTTVLATIFMVASITLAVISAHQSRSLMEKKATQRLSEQGVAQEPQIPQENTSIPE